MKISGLVRQFIRDYFVIFGILLIGSLLLGPANLINRDYVLLVMAFAFVGDLPSLVFWSRKELSENASRLRMMIHFILLETAILVFGGASGLVHSVPEYVVFGIEVAVIYLLVRFITWRGDLNTATRINQKLQDLKAADDEP